MKYGSTEEADIQIHDTESKSPKTTSVHVFRPNYLSEMAYLRHIVARLRFNGLSWASTARSMLRWSVVGSDSS